MLYPQDIYISNFKDLSSLHTRVVSHQYHVFILVQHRWCLQMNHPTFANMRPTVSWDRAKWVMGDNKLEKVSFPAFSVM